MTGSSPSPRPIGSHPERLEELHLVAALQRGDEAAFTVLVDRLHLSLIHLALTYLPDRTVAEEVVQETWLALVKGINGFEGRSSLKTWLFRVLTYQAQHRAEHEERIVSFSALELPLREPERFRPDGHSYVGHWVEPVAAWAETPEQQLLSHETLEIVESLVAMLVPRQRAVMILRDIEGLSAAETCEVLDIPDRTQRLLLHRARSRVRAGLASYLQESEQAS